MSSPLKSEMHPEVHKADCPYRHSTAPDRLALPQLTPRSVMFRGIKRGFNSSLLQTVRTATVNFDEVAVKLKAKAFSKPPFDLLHSTVIKLYCPLAFNADYMMVTSVGGEYVGCSSSAERRAPNHTQLRKEIQCPVDGRSAYTWRPLLNDVHDVGSRQVAFLVGH